MKNKHVEYLKKAIKLSNYNINNDLGGPFGAIIVKDGKIIAKGLNQVTSKNDSTAHAEIVAIRNACKKLKTFNLENCIIYCSCEPCPMCLGAIYWARISEVYFAATKNDAAEINFDDDFIYKEINKPLDKRKIKFKQLLRNEAVEVLNQWQNKENKTKY